MITRLRYKPINGTEHEYETTTPLLLGSQLVNIRLLGHTFVVTSIEGKELHSQYVSGGNHSIKKAVKSYLKGQGVPFADEVRKRKEIV